jgi:transposase-like protein
MMKARGAAGWLLVHVLTATRANATGHPEVLGVDVATSAEDSAGWLAFLTSDLTVRGLSEVSLDQLRHASLSGHRAQRRACQAALPLALSVELA